MNTLKTNNLQISFSTSYYQLGELSEKTKSIWIVCHGYGQLVKYFSRRFDVISSDENVILFPEALSQFYLDREYKNVGSSWMTKENRLRDIENIHTYLNQMLNTLIFPSEIEARNIEVVLFGFSQGATTVSRWAFAEKIPFDTLILWGGTIPQEVEDYDLTFFKDNAQIISVLGSEDPFFTEGKKELVIEENKRIFGQETYSNISYDGGHQILRNVLLDVSSKILI